MMDFSIELAYGAPSRLVAGVDEAGRGPWAGPVVAAAVILPFHFVLDGLADSKTLSPQKREHLAVRIKAEAIFGIGGASVREIDSLNILQASLLAMRRAVAVLGTQPQCALIDGNHTPDLPMQSVALIGGDGRAPSIAAASIIAKTTRDYIMTRLDARHPAYGWARNKGYGTKAHQRGLAEYGVNAHHRRSFRPIRIICEHGRA